MCGNDILAWFRTHIICHVIGKAGCNFKQTCFAGCLIIMYSGFDQHPGIVYIVLSTKESPIVSPSMVVFHKLGMGVDVSGRLCLLSVIDAVYISVDSFFQFFIGVACKKVGDTPDTFINESVIPFGTIVLFYISLPFSYTIEIPESITRVGRSGKRSVFPFEFV